MSWFDTTAFTTTFVTLLVIFGPPGSIPIFLALTAGLDARTRNAAARRAALVALGVIASFAVFGERLLDYLGITLPALQASGGLLLLVVAMQLLGLAGAPTEPRADAGVNVALVPLGTPILAGPGAIVATMLAVQRALGDPAAARGRRGPWWRRSLWSTSASGSRGRSPGSSRTAASSCSPGSPGCSCPRSRCR